MLNAALQVFQHCPNDEPTDLMDDIVDNASDRLCKRMVSGHATSDDSGEKILRRLSVKVISERPWCWPLMNRR
jgi:pyridoxal/pyridoxine/pyridoxamine kinase